MGDTLGTHSSVGWDRAGTASVLMSIPSRCHAAPSGQPQPQRLTEKKELRTRVSRELLEQQQAGHWQLSPHCGEASVQGSMDISNGKVEARAGPSQQMCHEVEIGKVSYLAVGAGQK